ncbi:MAG: response regulator [Candidatus Omnitrophota bacterium]
MLGYKPKLLVVDDEPDQSRTIKNYFSRRGFFVLTTANGEETLSLIKENKPDLVLLDLKLSGRVGGIDALRMLRKYDKATKVAIVTGDLLNERKIQEITDLGIVDFLFKPVDFQTLEKTIKGALKGNYPRIVFPKKSKAAEDSITVSLRHINHDLANIASDIGNKCELYILDTEQGINKDKSEKELLCEAIEIIKSTLITSKRLTSVINQITVLVKRGE